MIPCLKLKYSLKVNHWKKRFLLETIIFRPNSYSQGMTGGFWKTRVYWNELTIQDLFSWWWFFTLKKNHQLNKNTHGTSLLTVFLVGDFLLIQYHGINRHQKLPPWPVVLSTAETAELPRTPVAAMANVVDATIDASTKRVLRRIFPELKVGGGGGWRWRWKKKQTVWFRIRESPPKKKHVQV